MSFKNGEKLAFPSDKWAHDGLTKREYFALMLMQAIIASGSPDPFTEDAENAVRSAEALLKILDAKS